MGKYASKGMKVQVEIATVYTDITNVTNITMPDGTVGTWKSTSLETTGPSHTYAVTCWVDEGDMSASGFYDPSETTHDYMEQLRALTADAAGNYHRNWRIQLPTVGALNLGFWGFPGILTKWTPKGSLESPLEFDLGVKVSGNITYPVPA